MFWESMWTLFCGVDSSWVLCFRYKLSLKKLHLSSCVAVFSEVSTAQDSKHSWRDGNGIKTLWCIACGLSHRNWFCAWKHLLFRRFSFEEMQDHSLLWFQRTCQIWSNTASLLKLIRSAGTWEGRTVSNTHVDNMVSCKSNIYFIQIDIRLHQTWCLYIKWNTKATAESGDSNFTENKKEVEEHLF